MGHHKKPKGSVPQSQASFSPSPSTPPSSPGPSLSLSDQRRLNFLWQERMKIKMRIQELEMAIDRIKAEIEHCRQGRLILEQHQARVAIFIALSAGRSCQQERLYHQSRNVFLMQEYDALAK
jgi:hypothetical protein